MKHLAYNILLMILILTGPIFAQKTIHMYGPGGPHVALIEAAKLFEDQTSIQVKIVFGPQNTWSNDALKNADIIFSASDNQMTAFLQTYKQFNQNNVMPIYLHNSIILVQKGNPKNIKSIQDLIKKDVKIIVNDGSGFSQTSGTGVWEDILGKTGSIQDFAQFRKKIVGFVPNSGAGRAMFTDVSKNIDAWITWQDWALSNDLGQAVNIEKHLNIARPLNIVAKENASNEIKQFISFLTSKEAQKVFKKYGWYR